MAAFRSRAEWHSPVAGPSGLRFRFYAATDIGTTRAVNEDNFLIQPETGLFAVADGMGGHAGGEVASWITSEQTGRILAELANTVSTEWESTLDFSDTEGTPAAQREEELRFAVWETHADLRRVMREQPVLDTMGATLVVLLFRAQHVHVLNIGDSRTYRYVRGHGSEPSRADHPRSFRGKTGRMVGWDENASGLDPSRRRRAGYRHSRSLPPATQSGRSLSALY